MNNRHKKRWCDDCKMMVFATGHEHGRTEGREGILMWMNADYFTAVDKSKAYVAEEAIKAKEEGERIFWQHMGRKSE